MALIFITWIKECGNGEEWLGFSIRKSPLHCLQERCLHGLYPLVLVLFSRQDTPQG